MKNIFITKDNQIIYANNITEIIVGGHKAEMIEMNHVPDELFFDAMVNKRLYKFDKNEKSIIRNRSKRKTEESPPVITGDVVELKKEK